MTTLENLKIELAAKNERCLEIREILICNQLAYPIWGADYEAVKKDIEILENQIKELS
jgi:hypothetical protein